MNETKQKIVDGALELFSKNTFDGTSLRDIAAYAGVNVAMVSYYFGSKDGFFEYVIDRVYRRQKDFYQKLENQDLTKYQRLLELLKLEVNEIVDNFFSIKLIIIESKLQKRVNVVQKMIETINYVNEYMTQKIKEYKPEISHTLASNFSVMVHSSTYDLLVKKMKEHNINEFELNKELNKAVKKKIEHELFSIYKEFLDQIIK